MCYECHLGVCDPRCPNASQEESDECVECVECGEVIEEGDKYFNSSEGPICEACMEDMSTEEILELFGEQLTTA